ncbi:Enoyl-[acyl-carrier-protein] reductase [Candidatus Rhodobacter oscarellae]|uniref:Enoyl-[acyl-carrier-protein] reductase n=1 Tax=Candidatus Rhodobacter oscarellae TaxID=1675527 RepID=A0A0J9E8R0_9RHOB|nr:nitronate monooxygenase [Candidatus Rhodobacter lobularis]KMW59160.1 Enoyl-[acyl-carrier-protein] reductase [Candidatus Rhodobacter lobularis]
MKTSFCELMGVQLPIALAPMAGAVSPQLVAAVCNAGGLGLAPLWHLDDDALRDGIREIRALTDRPFGVNLNMEFSSEAHLDACLEEGVPIISLFWQSPGAFVSRAQKGGAKVIFTAATAASAAAAVELGVDAVCAQGWEAGGHVRGDVSTMALVPAVVDAVGDVPVIAAGGIADGRGLAAALALGASGAWIGTRFLAAQEALTHPDYMRGLVRATEADTAHFDNLFNVGWPDAPHRVLKNSTVRAWLDAGSPQTGARPGEGEIIAQSDRSGAVQRYQSITPNTGVQGDIEALSMWAGQGVHLVKRRQPAAEIIADIVAEAEATLAGLAGARRIDD